MRSWARMGDAGRAMMQQGKEAVRGVAAAAAQAVHQGLGAEPLEQFTDAWRQAEHLLENYHGDGDASPGTAVSADRCEALRSVLRRINELLEAEWEVEKAERQGRSTGNLMRGEDAGPCLEYLIRNVGGKGKLHVLCDNCDRSHPVEVRLVITEALRKMFMAVRHPLFWGSPMVQTPLQNFLQASRTRELRLPEQANDIVQLLGSVCDRLRSCEAELLPFFFNDADEEPFLLFDILVQFMLDEYEQEEAHRAVLVCVQLRDPDLLKYVSKTRFSTELASGLQNFYGQTLAGHTGASVAFFRLLEFCNGIVTSTGSQEIQDSIIGAVGQHFVEALTTSLQIADGNSAVDATCLARAIVNAISKNEVWQNEAVQDGSEVYMSNEAVQDGSEVYKWETHRTLRQVVLKGLTSTSTLKSILDRCWEPNSQLGLENLQLLSCLLDIVDETVYCSLVLKSVPASGFVDAQKFAAAIELPIEASCVDTAVQEAFWSASEFRASQWLTGVNIEVCQDDARVATTSTRVVFPQMADTASPLFTLLLDVMANFFLNSIETNIAVTASWRSIAHCPHPQLQRYVLSTAQNDDATLSGVMIKLCNEAAARLEENAHVSSDVLLAEIAIQDSEGTAPGNMMTTAEGSLHGSSGPVYTHSIVCLCILRGFVGQLRGVLQCSIDYASDSQ